MGERDLEERPATLSYVRDYTRSDIVVLRDGLSIRVISPKPPVWKSIVHWKVIMGLFFLTSLIGQVVALIHARTTRISDWIGLSQGLLWAAVGLGLLGHHILKSRQRRLIELSATHLSVGTLRGSTPMWDERWPRHLVAEIRPNRFTNALLIRIAGIDMKDYDISPDPKAVEMAAAALNDALHSADQKNPPHR